MGGGAVEDMRRSIAKFDIGGMKLITVAKVELGSRVMGNQKSHGIMMRSMTGVMRVCASRISLTAAPIAAMNEAIMKYARRKKMGRNSRSLKSRRPSVAKVTRPVRPRAA